MSFFPRFALSGLLLSFFVFSNGYTQDLQRREVKPLGDWYSTPSFIETRYSQLDGLPSNSLTRVLQGRDGYIYISSFAGIARFNGYSFESFPADRIPGLQNSRIVDFRQLPDGYFHAEIESGRSFLLTESLDRAFRLDGGSGSFRDLIYVDSEDDQTHVFISTNKMISLRSRDVNARKTVFEVPGDSIVAAQKMPDGRWWVLGEKSLYWLNDWKIVKQYPRNLLPFGTPHYFWVKQDERRQYWISGLGGTLLLDGNGEFRRTFFFGEYNEQVRTGMAISIDALPENEVAFNFVVFRLVVNLRTNQHKLINDERNLFRSAIPPNIMKRYPSMEIGAHAVFFNGKQLYRSGRDFSVSKVMMDSLDQIWIATSGDGLIRFQRNRFNVISKEHGLPGENLYTLLPDKSGGIWAASLDEGPFVIHSSLQNATFWPGKPAGSLCRSIFETAEGTILSGHISSAIWNLNPDSTWSLFSNATDFFGSWFNSAESFFEEEDGTLWMGTLENLLRRKPGETKFSVVLAADGTPIPRVRNILKKPDGRLLFLSGGLGFWTFDSLRGMSKLRAGTFNQPFARDVLFHSPKEWWIATENTGLVRYVVIDDSVRSAATVGTLDGLPDNAIHRIISDTLGFWWMPSNQGLIRVRESEIRAFVNEGGPAPFFDVFQEKQGLNSREFNGGTQNAGFTARDGRIWLPSQRGLVVFNPADFLHINSHGPARLIPMQMQTGKRVIKLSKNSTPELENTERELVVRFDAIYPGATKPAAFEYRPSRSSAWLPTGEQTFFALNNLEKGSHSVQIRQKNAGLNSPPLTISFKIKPFFYETPLFYSLVGISVAALSVGFVIVTQRISRRRQVRLERLVKERTRDLADQKNMTEEALVTVRKQAEQLEELDRYKTDLFLGFAHEFRTPLALIQGPLELLQQASSRVDTENAKIQLNLIRKNAGKLHKLVDRLLRLIRISDATEIQQQAALHLDAFLESTVKYFRDQLSISSKTIELEIKTPVGTVLTEPESLELMVNNLISNAIKYSGDATKIVVSLAVSEPFFTISVKNGGDPIPESDQKRIFDLFFRGSNSADQPGSGVGLTVVKRLTEKLNGRITLSSNDTDGTVFTLFLPFVPATAEIAHGYETKIQAPEPERHPVSRAEIPDVHLEIASENPRGPRLLIVEDNPDFRLLLETSLSPFYTLSFAENGRKGLEAFEANRFELIISDVMMPEMSGFEFAEVVRASDSGKHIPFVFLSANDRPESLAKGLSLGADAYLTKPVSLELLKAHLKALLTRKEALEKAAVETAAPETGALPPDIVRKIDELILLHLGNPDLSVDAMATSLNMSRATLYRAWEKTGLESINDRIVKTRLHFVMEMVKDKKFTFTQAALACGFSDSAYFSRVFKRVYGKSPRDFVGNSE